MSIFHKQQHIFSNIIVKKKITLISFSFISLKEKLYLSKVNHIEIKNLFFEGGLTKTGSNIRNTQLQQQKPEQDKLKETKS